MFRIDPHTLEKFNKPVPRYTSYPTAPVWNEPCSGVTYSTLLEQIAGPLSLYIHIPFCKTMCLFCGCSVVLNRKPENEELYVEYLTQEIALVSAFLKKNKQVTQLHFGGGTPTKLEERLLLHLMNTLCQHFSIDFSQEIAIEIDPRTVAEDKGAKLKFLKDLGFNRISFGVQDTDPRVQEAVKRRQTEKMTCDTFHMARSLGFSKINLDLIYGLPCQTQESFARTLSTICALKPDRIAFFSYAQTPWLKPHQNAINEKLLPTPHEKFAIYISARERFLQEGYCAIGMDHFALKTDELAESYHLKTLNRNFQGYTIRKAEKMISFGITSIGYLENTYIQNLKTLDHYYHALDRQELPVFRKKTLSYDDILRKWVILSLMCEFHVDKKAFLKMFSHHFDTYFAQEKEKLNQLEQDGLIRDHRGFIQVTDLGELFIRNVAHAFDAYSVLQKKPLHSQSI